MMAATQIHFHLTWQSSGHRVVLATFDSEAEALALLTGYLEQMKGIGFTVTETNCASYRLTAAAPDGTTTTITVRLVCGFDRAREIQRIRTRR